MREPAGQSPAKSESVPALARGSAAESERVILLEIRMEKLATALAEARGDADRLLGRIAAGAAREADHARRFSLVQQELADARAEIASLREHLTRSEALRARLEGHLFEGGGTDAAELIRLRLEAAVQRERASVNEESASRLRTRVDELLVSRDTLFSRLAEWQSLVQTGNSDAVDLGEFIAALRQDIMALEDRNAESESKEKALRELLARAGVKVPGDNSVNGHKESAAAEADVPSTPHETRAEADSKEVQGALTFEGFLGSVHHQGSELGDLWESEGEPNEENAAPESTHEAEAAWSEPEEIIDAAVDSHVEEPFANEVDPEPQEPIIAAVEPELVEELVPMAMAADSAPAFAPVAEQPAQGLAAADPVERAASIGRLNRDLEDRPSQLTDHLRSGLADVDPRVRRRAVLVAATARDVELRPLLEPLRNDPDPQVRRVVREVLRYAPATEVSVHDSAELG